MTAIASVRRIVYELLFSVCPFGSIILTGVVERAFSFLDFSWRLCAIYGRFLCVCVLPGAKVLVAADGIRNRGRGADSVDAVSWAALTSLPIQCGNRKPP